MAEFFIVLFVLGASGAVSWIVGTLFIEWLFRR